VQPLAPALTLTLTLTLALTLALALTLTLTLALTLSLKHLASKPQQTTRTLSGLMYQVRDGLLMNIQQKCTMDCL